MAHLDFPLWLVPFVLGVVPGVVALVRMWGRLGSSDQRLEEHGKDLSELKARVDAHDIRHGVTDITLARIEAGIEYLKRAFDSAIGKAS